MSAELTVAEQCEKSPSGRHRLAEHNGKPAYTDARQCEGMCHECKRPIRRAHRWSTWWHTTD